MMNQSQMNGQVALVTGGGRGLGRAFARTLAANGMRVGVLARKATEVDETVRLVEAAGGVAFSIYADVKDATAVHQAVEAVEAQLGPIDLLVNNAGKFGPIDPLHEADGTEWEDAVKTNVFGTRNCLDAVLNKMIPRGKGRIIVMASSTPLYTRSYISSYAGSKAFLIKLVEDLAPEIEAFGISVFSMHPGSVLTEMSRPLLESPKGKKYLDWFSADDPIEGACKLVAFLASGAADSLSGRFFDATRPSSFEVERMDTQKADDINLLRMKFIDSLGDNAHSR